MDAKENTSTKKGSNILSKAKVQKTDLSSDVKNVKDIKKSTSGNDSNEEDGWTQVVSKKRKIVMKKNVNTCKVDEKCSPDDQSSDDSFITLKDPKKKKVVMSKTKKVTSHASKCPICMNSFKSVLQHLNKSKLCKSQCTDAQRELLQNEIKLSRTEKQKVTDKKFCENKRRNDKECLRKRNKINNHKCRL